MIPFYQDNIAVSAANVAQKEQYKHLVPRVQAFSATKLPELVAAAVREAPVTSGDGGTDGPRPRNSNTSHAVCPHCGARQPAGSAGSSGAHKPLVRMGVIKAPAAVYQARGVTLVGTQQCDECCCAPQVLVERRHRGVGAGAGAGAGACAGSTTGVTDGEASEASTGAGASVLDTHPFVLCHNDLAPKNIMVHPDTLAFTAVLDWEWAGPRAEVRCGCGAVVFGAQGLTYST